VQELGQQHSVRMTRKSNVARRKRGSANVSIFDFCAQVPANKMTTGQEELREQAAYDESYPPQAQQQFSPISAPPNAHGAEAGYAPGQYYPPPPGPGYTPQPPAYGHEQYPPPPGTGPQISPEYGYHQPTGYTPPPPNAGQHPYSPPPDPYGPGGRARRADENVSAALSTIPLTPTPSRAAKRYMPVDVEGGSLPSPRPLSTVPSPKN